jgi:CopA family copper-resistance protein
MKNSSQLSRRHFLQSASSAIALASLPASQLLNAQPVSNPVVKNNGPTTLSGNEFNLRIGYQEVNYTGKKSIATTVNGSLPAPILRWKEGDRVKLRVTNDLHEDSSIHWHGIILPSTMDGSPGFDFAGIKPGETFNYEFDVKQSGTYWYHSHSGFQEQTGLLGAIIIDPKEPDPIVYDREFIILLSDWTDTAPAKIYSRLKKMSHYYNYSERTLADNWADIKTKGIAQTWNERAMWNRMRMSDRDIADVTAYTYLINGLTPAENWTGLCKAGEKIRLRIINGAAMTIFDVRIPGLKMTVVAADGQAIQPVEVDEFRIGTAETYDVLVTLDSDKANTFFAQTIDRSGFACATLTTSPTLRADIPALDPAPVLDHQDMGMDMSGMDHSQHRLSNTNHQHDAMNTMEHGGHDMGAMEKMDHSEHNMNAMDHSTHDMNSMSSATATTTLAKAGVGSNFDIPTKVNHTLAEYGPHVDMHSDIPRSGLNDPGLGLRDHAQKYNRKVLRYADLRSLYPTRDKREPTREIELHLNGNMHRYMWSINGKSFMNAAPIALAYGERVRIILVNDTMMTHPIHLHGMWSELETGDPDFIPRKHTILVQPGAKISYLVSADAKGSWAYHCHLLYHMFGMMRMVKVV